MAVPAEFLSIRKFRTWQNLSETLASNLIIWLLEFLLTIYTNINCLELVYVPSFAGFESLHSENECLFHPSDEIGDTSVHTYELIICNHHGLSLCQLWCQNCSYQPLWTWTTTSPYNSRCLWLLRVNLVWCNEALVWHWQCHQPQTQLVRMCSLSWLQRCTASATPCATKSQFFLNELLHMFKNHFIPVHYVTIYQEFECQV